LSEPRTDGIQNAVAAAADRADAHSTAPALLLQLQAALGNLCATADEATGGGRRPFRVPPGWSDRLGDVAYLVYLMADQTGTDLDSATRGAAFRVVKAAAQQRAVEPISDSWP
jgi:hypothetical protein